MLYNKAQKEANMEKSKQKYRLVTRSDFDGLVCAVLLKELDLINDIKELQIEKYVMFHGYIADKNVIYNNTDILISCSYHEGFGLSLIEAMAYQVPTIGYINSAGPSSIIRNNITGILVNENTSKAYEKAILQYITNEKFKNEIIKNATKDFHEKFSLNVMIEKYNNMLKYCL